MEDREFFLELGVEEVPSGLLNFIQEQIKDIFIKKLAQEGISHREIFSHATPSRVILQGKLSPENLSQIREIQGPSYKVAFDDKGNPTQAYFGFLKSQQGKKEDLIIKETARGKYLFLVKKKSPEKTRTILKRILPEVIFEIPLPKYMRWDNSGLKFIRPIRWLVVIYNDEILKIKIGNLISSNFTILREGAGYIKVKIRGVKDYFRKLKQAGIIISSTQRKKKIESGLKQKARDFKAILSLNPELISEVTNLVERPYVIGCNFKKEFLKLPEVVLLASMAKYQRVFALKDKNGRFLNKFLAVIESRPAKLNRVKKHYEFVLNTRLWDANYFFKEDTKEHLEKKVPYLKEVLMHQKLGSIYNKIEILKIVAEKIAEALSLSNKELENLLRALWLSKADLLTKMVNEFPSLEGLMGGIYAKYFGENDKVVNAISEHYKPRTSEDDIPSTKLGAILSLLDKSYNIIALLGIAERPTGSEDRFMIRRQAQAIVRIIVQHQFEISLSKFTETFFELLKGRLSLTLSELKESFLTLCKERFQFLMREEGLPRDLIIGVTNINFDSPSEVYLRIRKLLKIYHNREFFYAAKVVERISNIIKDEKEIEKTILDEKLFRELEEKKLWKIYLENKDKIIEKINSRDYDKAILLYGKVFYDIIHLFFDKVLVNVEEELLRKNRKVLLYLIKELLTQKVADFKEMEVLKNAGS